MGRGTKDKANQTGYLPISDQHFEGWPKPTDRKPNLFMTTMCIWYKDAFSNYVTHKSLKLAPSSRFASTRFMLPTKCSRGTFRVHATNKIRTKSKIPQKKSAPPRSPRPSPQPTRSLHFRVGCGYGMMLGMGFWESKRNSWLGDTCVQM